MRPLSEILFCVIVFAVCGFVAGLWTRWLVTAVFIGLTVGLALIAVFLDAFNAPGGLRLSLLVVPVAATASVAGCMIGRNRSRLGVLGLSLSTVLIPLCLSLLATMPRVAPQKGRRAVCLSNLKQIGLALAMYAEANHGHLPPENGVKGLNFVYPKYVTSSRVFHCTNDKIRRAPLQGVPLTEDDCSYVYVGGPWQSKDNTNAVPISWDKTENHGNAGLTVLFNDGHAQWMSLDEWQKIKPNK